MFLSVAAVAAGTEPREGATRQPRRAASGCRPQSYLGLWAMEPSALRNLEDQVREALRSGLIQAPSAAWDYEDDRPAKTAKPPYRILRGVAVIEIHGAMTKYESSWSSYLGGCSSVRTKEAIRGAVRDQAVRGILLKIDSPGGTVAGTADLAEAVKAANAKKPVFAYCEDQTCSAAYWVASQARKVYANSTAIVGSIGTYAAVWDTSGMYAEAGIKVHVISSAPLKGAGTDGQAVTDEMLADWQREISELNEVFENGFAKGRKMPIARARELADGRVHVGTHAQGLGLIDVVASFDAAFKDLEKTMANPTDKDTLDLAAEAEDRAVKAEGELAETKKTLVIAQKETADLKTRLAALEAAASGGDTAKTEDPLAGLSPAARERIQALEKEAAESKAKVEQLQTDARKKEFATQAGAFKHLPVKAEEFGEVLRECADKLKPETVAELNRVLKAADTAAKPLFEEKGSSGVNPAGGAAADQIEARAKALVAEGKAKDIQAARDMAWKENPELYKQHMRERRAS